MTGPNSNDAAAERGNREPHTPRLETWDKPKARESTQLRAADVNTSLTAGLVCLGVLARAHLWDPYWPRHAATTLDYTLPWPPAYESLDRYKPRI
mgnify:CR=1 FL=1